MSHVNAIKALQLTNIAIHLDATSIRREGLKGP